MTRIQARSSSRSTQQEGQEASGPLLSAALVPLAQWLRAEGYRFTTVTPATHARVLARDAGPARGLRDVFGWSRPFRPALLPARAMDLLQSAGLAEPAGAGLLRSKVRFSSLGAQLCAHDAYPTTAPDAVFFGPDTYRFVQLVEQELAGSPLRPGARILDVGCGSGAGGIAAALASGGAMDSLVLADINARALAFASANAAHAGCSAPTLVQGDLYAPVEGDLDFVVANPPYLNDRTERAYRHGGGRFGEALSLRIVREGLPRLAPGGRLVLYTGVAMAQGHDPLLEALAPELEQGGWDWRYEELDPDVFGEELDEPAYAEAERIAAVALVVRRA
ncbi:methyltransferase [Ramlibacter sp. USB13]|uniref:Methyltransferase n=1 Tax=Ramlibacter cellulosilyticus TaxID=2764187 RepID=A0A923MUN5_9BURK|nr:methyltransferase [Ramlibacter cellulosilyticus]MBC5784504.1 methyltransferase [Ramlibacter cellulosilyticus]